ncbi:MAG: hypothetical protein ACXVHJ_22015, partial [Solirubrobacteraceae bacterium]
LVSERPSTATLALPRAIGRGIGLKCVVRGFSVGRPSNRSSSQVNVAAPATNQKRAGSLADPALTLGFTRKGALAVEVRETRP